VSIVYHEIILFVAEFAALKDECAQLRQRILDIENEMKKYVFFCFQKQTAGLCLSARSVIKMRSEMHTISHTVFIVFLVLYVMEALFQ
jgi:DNA polymerase III sliding clamp (beta) subunit (PCNA family)